MSDSKAVVTQQERNITDGVLSRVQALSSKGDLVIPKNYSAENALKSAWLKLQEVKDRNSKLALEVCTKESIANALMDMVVQGLNPIKKQCYFVVYGNQLTLMRSYLGTVAVTKRLKGVKDVKAYCIYEGDEFEQEFDLETATLKITKFNPKFENIDLTKIKGAFAVVIGDEGPIHTEVMNINQIKKAWAQGAAKGNSGAHTNFTDEMAKKTVINRACKPFVNSSDDSDILIDAFNNSDEKTYDEKDIIENVQAEVEEEVKEKGNKKTLDIKSEPQPQQTSPKAIDVEATPVQQDMLEAGF